MSRYSAATVEVEDPLGETDVARDGDGSDDPAGDDAPPVIHFGDGILGFPGCTDFVLLDISPDSAFQILQCLQDPDVSMIVAVPWLFFPDYEPELGETEREQLGITAPEDAIVFCSVTLEPDDDTVYLNLMGPFVVHQATLQGRQLVLADSEHPVRAAVRLAEL
jgi:flagellar assembly factor FliW